MESGCDQLGIPTYASAQKVAAITPFNPSPFQRHFRYYFWTNQKPLNENGFRAQWRTGTHDISTGSGRCRPYLESPETSRALLLKKLWKNHRMYTLWIGGQCFLQCRRRRGNSRPSKIRSTLACLSKHLFAVHTTF